MKTSCQLNLLQLPLRGQHLIEASAGTGKTYTLASLVIRLLLGHGGYPPLTIERILVVTFTNAATAELRERIRQKIMLTYQAFLGCPCADDVIMALVEQTPQSEYQQAKQWLNLALRSLDNSSIFTIHSFCRKLLSELAFEAGQLFEQQLRLDSDAFLQQACQDAWRYLCYEADPKVLACLYPKISNPDDLQRQLKHVLKPVPLTAVPSTASFSQVVANFMALVTTMQTDWPQHQAEQLAYLKERDLFKKNYGEAEKGYPKLQTAWDALTEWLQQPHQLLPNDLSKLSLSKLKITKKSLPVDPAKLSLLVAVDELLMQQQQLQIVFYQTARITIQDRLRRLKAQESILFADDLMVQLKQAITEHSQRDRLIELIRERFPVALIDEFQDTDAIQFDIFEKLYRDQNQLGWYMIGDPKQAIYAFRGADIFTYMQAKADTSNQHHLTTNYRSASDMVDAVNQLFTSTARNPFVYDMITYQPVLAHQTTALQLPHDTAALHFRYQATDCTFKTKADATRAAADDCAQHITDLLNQAQLGQAHIKGRRLEPRDIAILVRSGSEAKVVAQALANRGVGSVYLSRDRVFETPEAEAMTFVLKAMAYPKQELAIRNALATPLLGRTYTQINQFNHDEDERCYWLEKFAYYHQLWHQQNWLVAFAQLMLDSQMASRLLQQANGARQLTDIRHLSEIIQAESQRLTGSQALLNWYEQQCHQPDMPVDTQQLRLESERNLITITTIHKSKGLEYNLCWLPFLSLVNQHRKTTIGNVYHDDNQQLLWNCAPNSDAKAKQDDIDDKVKQEELAEAIRLLYVAFTRAKYRVYTHIAQVKINKKNSAEGNFDKSPLGFLLGCEQAMTTEQLIQHLQAFVQAPHTALVPVATEHHLESLTKLAEQAPKELHVLPPNQPLQSPWWLSSYSGLVRRLTHPHRTPIEQPLTTADPQLKQRFEFDRGAHIGTFLHQIFEDIEFADPDSLTIELPLIMERYQIDAIHYTMLHTWVTEVLATELQPRLHLNQLQSQQVFKELEFFMPMQTLTDTDLNQLLQAYNYTTTPALNFDTLQGMLKGFVDLVFEWEGRYYIADYKSNFLGIHEQDYSADKLQQAINEHRYDVQYLLYTVALHLMLQLSVSDYQYETHFGGCYYLFIRAMQPQQTHGIFFDRPNPALIETLAGYFQQQAHSTC